jgi:hypothetical protein
VPELDGVPQAGRKRRQCGREPLVVAAEGRRQLPEQRPELRRAQQRLDALEQER